MEIESRIKEKMLRLLEEIVDNPNPHSKPDEWAVFFGDVPVFRVLSILSKMGPRVAEDKEADMTEADTLTPGEKDILIEWLMEGAERCEKCRARVHHDSPRAGEASMAKEKE